MSLSTDARIVSVSNHHFQRSTVDDISSSDVKIAETFTRFNYADADDNTGSGGISSNADGALPSDRGNSTVSVVLKVAVFCVIIVGTIVGNLLVCAAVCLTRKLRSASNLLIVSLAIADLLVGTVDMPFAVVYHVTGRWLFGQTICDLWTSIDVLVCTASILNLCMISIDRYMTVTKPFAYTSPTNGHPIRIVLMISSVWIVSTVVTVPPLLGWKPDMAPGECEVSQDKGYQLFATVCAFYLPLCIMVVVYAMLYHVSFRLANAAAAVQVRRKCSLTPISETAITAFQQIQIAIQQSTTTAGSCAADDDQEYLNSSRSSGSLPNMLSFPFASSSPPSSPPPPPSVSRIRRRSRSQSLADVLIRMNCRFRDGVEGIGVRLRAHDRKATRTLGVIMGAFVACWLPFFVLAVTKPFLAYPSTTWTRSLDSLFLWLGYTNSLLNPVIYARFNRDFRTPFKCILQCRCADINSRLRSEDFAEQFGRLQVYRTVPFFPAAGVTEGPSAQVTPGRSLSGSSTAVLSSSAVAARP